MIALIATVAMIAQIGDMILEIVMTIAAKWECTSCLRLYRSHGNSVSTDAMDQ